MDAWLITDPWFYAAALPAAFLIGLSKSGFAGGMGALATPLVAMVVSVPRAAAILLPVLMLADLTGLKSLWRQRDARLLRILLPAGLAGILLGWATFGWLSSATVSGLVGALTLLFLVQRLFFPLRRDPSGEVWTHSGAVGRVLALISGFTSFIAHAGGPPIAAYLLPMRLAPLQVAGTGAVFFAAINAAKVLPYASLGLIDLRHGLTSLVLMPMAPLGVWVGVWAMGRVSATAFYRLAYTGMALTGVKLLWDAWR
jgi:uncharacterized membrane protein YfcA